MNKPSDKRKFAMIETYMWRDPIFRSLTESARMLWVHLLSSPRTTRLPGLIPASVLTIMSDLGWDKPPEGELQWSSEEVLTRGIQRLTQAFAILEGTKHRSDTPWVIVDRNADLIILPRRVSHMMPQNQNIVKGWLTQLKEVPPSYGKDVWVVSTVALMVRQLGKDDRRVQLLKESYQQAVSRLGESSAHNWALDRAVWGGQGSSSATKKTAVQTVEQTVEQTVSKPLPEPLPKDLDLDVDLDLDTDKGLSVGVDQNRKVGRSTPSADGTDLPPASAAPGEQFNLISEQEQSNPQKDPAPPKGASTRLCLIYAAMQGETFEVPGKGEQTIWENASRPRKLAEKLENSFPGVNIPQLISNLAGWTVANPSRAKVDLQRFLWNRARAEQDRPRPQQTSTHRGEKDLAEKVRRGRGPS